MRKIFLIYLCTLIFLTGCDQIIDYEIPVEPSVPVVNAFLNPDSIFSINLTGSRHVLDNNYHFNPLEGYEVFIFQNDHLIGEAVNKGKGYFKLENYYPEYGQIYSIEIKKAGTPTVSARDLIPVSRPEFSILSHRISQEDYSTFHIFELELLNPQELTFFEIAAFAYSYEYEWQQNGPRKIIDSTYLAFPVFTDNPIADNSANFYGRPSILFSNNLINTSAIKVEISVGYIPASEVDIIVRRVSENYFYFLQSFRLQQESSGDPLAEPVMVYSNIENGLGIFGSYVQSKTSYLVSSQ